MEQWLPLMNIFMNSLSPQTEASLWLQSSFNSSSTHISTASFLNLLMQPTQAIVPTSSSSSPIPNKQRFMWMQTLPNMVQARILSFLVYENAKFNKQELSKLARELLFNATEVDFWVRRGAHQLFDVVSDSNFKWVSCLNLDSEEEKFEEKFGSLPGWLNDVASGNDAVPVLPWLPVSVDDMNTRLPDVTCEDDEDVMVDVEDGNDVNLETIGTQHVTVHSESDPVDHETKETALRLKMKILNMESGLKAAELTDEIRTLIKQKQDSLTVLSLIEPWNVNDEIIPVLLSRLLEGNEDDFVVTSNILCSVVLPKFLELEKPASRVLVTTTVDYCKVHHKSAVYAFLFPLILHKNGINNPICDVITRIIKECLHPAHVSAICQKLLCEENTNGNEYVCLPCHQHLVSESLVWTESLFNLFQIILNHDVRLTQDSVNRLVFHVQESAIRFAKSLKFANFLLCFVSKCAPLLGGPHKVALSEAVGNTSSFLTKSILSKLASIDS
ncbi:putative fanconi anemia group E protein [Helianthus annuus]|nr:putative fanconi anemia group E protein [Helianthus annuus]KAJ0941773.1 putative fanconi anemia group E protein [Helianthus annuus]